MSVALRHANRNFDQPKRKVRKSENNQTPSHLQLAHVGHARPHRFQVHLHEVVFHAASFSGGENFLPVQRALTYSDNLSRVRIPALHVHGDEPARWYDGGLMPARPEELAENVSFQGGNENDEGLLFIGDHGKIFCGFNGENPRLISEEKMRSFVPPPKALRAHANKSHVDLVAGRKHRKPECTFHWQALLRDQASLVG